MVSTVVYDVVILGAGISGLCLAKKLTAQNQKVLILEKSRSVGGRLATRRDEKATYDHGAQFYKLKHDEVDETDQLWRQQGVSIDWFQDADHLFKASPKGMTNLAKALSQGLEIIFNERITQLVQSSEASAGQVLVQCESGQSYLGRKVVLSAPLPQSLEILKVSQIAYPAELAEIQYAKALVGLFEMDPESSLILEELKYQQNVNERVFSISNQKSKAVSSQLAFTVTMQPLWSDQYFEDSEEKTLQALQEEFRLFCQQQSLETTITKSQLKKWRYSHPLKNFQDAFLQLPESPQIFLMGDAFGGGSIRGALRSAESLFKSHF